MRKPIHPYFFFTLLFLPSCLYLTESAIAIIWIKPLLQLVLLGFALYHRSLRFLALCFGALILWQAVPLWQTSFTAAKQVPTEIEATLVKLPLQKRIQTNSLLAIQATSFSQGQIAKQSYWKLKLKKKRTIPFFLFNSTVRITANTWHIDQQDKHTLIADKLYIHEIDQEKKIVNANPLFLFLLYKGYQYLEGFSQQAYMALVSGSSQFLSKEVKTNLNELGIRHVFVLSGLHIGLVYTLFFSIFMFVFFRFSYRYAQEGKVLLLIRFFSIGLLLTCLWLFQSPITAIRSFTMFAVYWFFISFGFNISLWLLFLISINLLTIYNPAIIANLSFILSALCVSTICWTLPFLPQIHTNDSILLKLGKTLFATSLISISIFIATFPLITNLQTQISLFFPIHNNIHIFFLSVIFLPLILLACVVLFIGYFIPLPQVIEQIVFLPIQFTGSIWHSLLKYSLQWLDYPIAIHYTHSGIAVIIYLVSFHLLAYIATRALRYKQARLPIPS